MGDGRRAGERGERRKGKEKSGVSDYGESGHMYVAETVRESWCKCSKCTAERESNSGSVAPVASHAIGTHITNSHLRLFSEAPLSLRGVRQ